LEVIPLSEPALDDPTASGSDFEFTVPVLIVGGGAAGCVAALAAHDAGATPLLVERDDRPSGTTGLSQGLFCAAGTRSQAAHGVDDDAERFLADILAKTRGQTDPVIARAIAEGSGPCLEWLVDEHHLPWELDTGFRAVYGNSRMRVHGWRGRGGQDMIQLLHRRLGDLGIDVLLQARLVEIIGDADGRALGIEVERPGGARERIGCETLVIASGGFAANHERVARHMPEAAKARHNGHEGNHGDGIWLGERLGAALGDMGAYQGYAMLTDPQGVTVPPGIIVEGGILVNALGRRFVNEMEDIAGMVHPVMAQPDGMAWVIYDAGIEDRCAYIPETIALKALNAARKADSVEALSELIGVDPAILAASLADAEAARAATRPDAVGRIWAEDRPPAPTFHALRVVGAIYHTQGGLQIDGEARVLRPDGTALPNLFAAGGAARGVSGPSSWGYLPAMGLCAAVTLGRIAGRSAARLAGSGG
jgi:fumarate reductase flavoprotein subunit